MTDLLSPRYLIYTPTEDILVSEPNANCISCLLDTDNDGYPDQRIIFVDASNGLNRPYGMVFADGLFYVSIGSASNVNIEDLSRASIQQSNLDGTNQSTFAFGLRNPVGLAIHPINYDLYLACQERDLLSDDLVPDYFTHAKQDEFYGWLYAYLSPNLTDPRRCLENETNRLTRYYEDFLYEFLTSSSGRDTFGRSVGLLMLNDRSLIFTEDGNNRIYQVQYNTMK